MQLHFEWSDRLTHQTGFHMSWRDAGCVTQVVTVGAYSVDYAWPWWAPHDLTFRRSHD